MNKYCVILSLIGFLSGNPEAGMSWIIIGGIIYSANIKIKKVKKFFEDEELLCLYEKYKKEGDI